MGANIQGIGKGGHRFLEIRNNIRGGGPGGSAAWVGDVGDDTTYWEGFGRIPPQGGLQADKMATLYREGR